MLQKAGTRPTREMFAFVMQVRKVFSLFFVCRSAGNVVGEFSVIALRCVQTRLVKGELQCWTRSVPHLFILYEKIWRKEE